MYTSLGAPLRRLASRAASLADFLAARAALGSKGAVVRRCLMWVGTRTCGAGGAVERRLEAGLGLSLAGFKRWGTSQGAWRGAMCSRTSEKSRVRCGACDWEAD